MSFIKSQDQINDYSYVELGIEFGERKTHDEIFEFTRQLAAQLAFEGNGRASIQIKKIDFEHPEDKE